MNELDIDQRLEREGARWRAAATSGNSFDASFAALRRDEPPRAWSRWATPVAAAAAVVVVFGATFAAVVGHQHRQSGPVTTAHISEVPWATATVPVPVPTSATPSSASAAGDHAPHCESADFTAGPVSTAPIAGAYSATWTIIRVALTYHGTSACQLDARGPSVQLLGARGQVLGLGYDTFDYKVSDVLVKPNQLVLTGATWSSDCGFNEKPDRLALVFGSGGSAVRVSLDAGDPASPGCVRASDAFPVLGERPVVVDAGNLDSLLTSVSAPVVAQRTSPLEFSVQLTNPGPTAVPLAPCPTFVISVLDPARRPDLSTVRVAQQLNCARAPATIGPGESVRLRMQLDLSTSSTGERALSWNWAGVDAQPVRSLSATIQVH